MSAARKVIFDKKNVVVVGGAGFIGSHLCDELVKNSKVICIDNYSSGGVENISHLLQNPNFVFLKHDISLPLDLSTFPELEIFQVGFQGIQEIYYLAVPTLLINFEELAIETAKANSIGVINALEIARAYEARFLMGSTRSVYGDPLQGQEVFEESYWGFVDPLSERACYNEGKRFAETVTNTYHTSLGMDTKIARIFNTYGPRMRLNSGRMIPDFVRSAINNQSVVVHGDGTQKDSYCYIDDMIQGLVALMQSNVNEPVNLGNPETFSMIDVANKIIVASDSKSTVVFEDEISGLVRYAPPDISRAKRYLGWFPVTDISTGLERTVADMMGSQVLSYQMIQEKSEANSPSDTPTVQQ